MLNGSLTRAWSAISCLISLVIVLMKRILTELSNFTLFSRSEMVDSTIQRNGYGHKVGNFNFLNQDNKPISLNDVKGKVFV